MWIYDQVNSYDIDELTWPWTAHSSTTKTHNYFLAHPTPLLNQVRTCLIAAKWKTTRYLALSITIILRCRPSIGYCECNYNVRVSINLLIGRTSLPVSNVGNEAAIFSVISIIVKSRRWRRIACWRTWSGWAWTRWWRRLTITVALAAFSTVSFWITTIAPLTAAHAIGARIIWTAGIIFRSWLYK